MDQNVTDRDRLLFNPNISLNGAIVGYAPPADGAYQAPASAALPAEDFNPGRRI